MKKPDFKRALNEMLSKPTSDKTQAVMSQGQVIDIMTYNSYSFTVLQFLKRKNRFRILETRGVVPVSWTTPIHTKRYNITI
ncbi:MAG TPA: hypothetical protein DIS88_06770 [Prevotella sp.]|nr:hypothetical protein [Prevotella sp.]